MVDWRKILIKHGLQIPLERREFNIRCPWHEDRHPSLSINLEKGVFICHAGCGQGTLTSFISRMTGEGVSSLLMRSEDADAVPDNTWADMLFEHIDDGADIYQVLPVRVPFENRNIPDWVFARGFSPDDAVEWDWRTSDSGSLVIPILNEQDVTVGWACRQPDGRSPKYIFSRKLRTSALLFGLNRIKRMSVPGYICIVEGMLDCIWLWKHGFASVALFGVNLSSHQERMLRELGVGEFVLCHDNDVPGQTALEVAFSRLKRYCVVSRIHIRNDYKDVQDIRDPVVLAETIEDRTIF